MADLHIKQLAERCTNRLGIEQGSFIYDPSLGSKLHHLKRSKNVADVHALAELYAAEALEPELKKRTIQKITAVRLTGRTINTASFVVDIIANTGASLTLNVEV